jgi:hypothetical protein
MNNKEETILIEKEFDKGEHKIYIEYIHCIGVDMDGLYYVKKDNSIIFSTQLEPIYARKVFPCFDEPNFKSKFNITIESDKNKTFLSNMPEKKSSIVNNNKIVKFEESPLMSTYLVCIVIGDVKKAITANIDNRILVNGYYFDKSVNLMNDSVKVTAESIKYFEKLFGINYKLSKADIIAIPNFLSGAMENWGLITFRESGLMTDKVDNIYSLINSIEVIYHEISHQWFGNLVTLNSWKNIWLNEATATYFSWLGLKDNYKNYYPEQWYYLTTYRAAMLIDGFDATHPISTEITSSNDIVQFFDEISYSKGSCLINYISEFMSRKEFMQGINEYLEKYSWKTTEPKDLYLILDNHSNNQLHSISELIKEFISIKGFPLLTVTKDKDKYIIKKNKFLLINEKLEEYNLNFPIKIRYCDNLKEESIEIKDTVQMDKEFILNADNMMLCIINYSNFNPKIETMKIEEIMHYFDGVFYLAISGYKKLECIFETILTIFDVIDFKENLKKTTCLFNLIIKNVLQLNYILKSSNTNNSFMNILNNFIDILKPKIRNILIHINKNEKKDIFITNWLNDIFNFYIDIEDRNIIKLGKKIFDEFYEKTKADKFNNFPLHEVIFKLVVKYYDENDILSKINEIKDNSEDIFVKNSALWAITYSNNTNYLTKYMKEIFNNVKLQDISTFIYHLSKNLLIQKTVVEWIFNDIKNNSNITYKNFAQIIERITVNIYDVSLLEILQQFYLNENDSSIYAIELDKIKWHKAIIKNILKNNN